jgi:Rieske 2Fe-2S family protein
VLRAFANSCRHRGHELLACGQGAQGQAIVCPYHAWTYSLEGELRAAAGFRRQPGFDFGQWGLPQLPVTEWHGLVFVDGSGGQSGSLTDALAKLDELVAPYEPERLVTARTTTSATTAPPSTPSCAGSARPRAARTTPPTGPGSAAGWTCARG